MRMSELTLNENTYLRTKGLYLIALAISVDPGELMKEIFGDLKVEID